ncbi:MAG: lycopene cyclase domain-containing protein [Naasia sp.]
MYLAVNTPFLVVSALLAVAAVIVEARRGGRSGLGRRGVSVVVALVGLLVLTAIFDNVIIGTGVVDYDHSLTSGIRLGLAPVEDFAYAFTAGLALPAVWLLVPPRRKDR